MTTRIAVFALLLLMAGLPAAQADDTPESCDAALAEFHTVRNADDLAKLKSAYANLAGLGCSEQVLFCAGQSVALAHLQFGYARADEGAGPAAVRDVLDEGQKFGSPWQLLVGLGDTSMAVGLRDDSPADYQKAARSYQDALNTITEQPVCGDFGEPPLPGENQIASIHKRMTEALMLAPRFETVKTRSGNCGGIFLSNIRGFTPTFRPIPVNFEFDQATFTEEGRRAADLLLECVMHENYAKIVLSGHTDPKGSDAYNMALSERRLAAVRQFLAEGGFTGELVLEPKGETEPFEPDDPTAYTEAQLDQLNRRVVLRETVK